MTGGGWGSPLLLTIELENAINHLRPPGWWGEMNGQPTSEVENVPTPLWSWELSSRFTPLGGEMVKYCKFTGNGPFTSWGGEMIFDLPMDHLTPSGG